MTGMLNSHRQGADKPLPTCIPGYQHINRYWDPRMETFAAKILPGELYVSDKGEMIVTVLGSCISACIRDVKLGIGGMNHFMLPQQNGQGTWGDGNLETRYGNWAMEMLINEIMKLGGSKSNMEVKLFGGGKVLENATNVGNNNINFARDFLISENLRVAASDVGGIYPRKVLYFPDTGAVKVRKMKTTKNATIAKREAAYSKTLVQEKSTDIELF